MDFKKHRMFTYQYLDVPCIVERFESTTTSDIHHCSKNNSHITFTHCAPPSVRAHPLRGGALGESGKFGTPKGDRWEDPKIHGPFSIPTIDGEHLL